MNLAVTSFDLKAYEKLELWKDAFADVKLLLRIETKDPAVQDLARRINAKVTQINDAQHTTSNLVDDMLSALENSSTPQDKVQKVGWLFRNKPVGFEGAKMVLSLVFRYHFIAFVFSVLFFNG